MKKLLIFIIFLNLICVLPTYSSFVLEIGNIYYESCHKYYPDYYFNQANKTGIFHSLNNSELGLLYNYNIGRNIILKFGLYCNKINYTINDFYNHYGNYYYYYKISTTITSFKLPLIFKFPILKGNKLYLNLGFSYVYEFHKYKRYRSDIINSISILDTMHYNYIELTGGITYRIKIFDYILYPEIMYDYLLTPIYLNKDEHVDIMSYSYTFKVRFSIGIDLKSFTNIN